MAVTSEIATTRYITDAAASRFQIKGFVGGVLSALGHNPTIAIRDFAGEVRFQPGTLDAASLELRLKASSFEVTNQIRDKDKREIEENMHRDVLETDQFPEIVFRSSAASAIKTGEGQFRIDLNGSLTLHGVTRPQPIQTYVTVSEERLRARGDFSILLSDYQIRPVSAVGGTLKLKDELKCSFEIVARRKRE
jgi:polyisoprenoid-binding protein YceI